MDNFSENFGGWLRQTRKYRQLTLTQLAERSGITQAQLSHIENQKSAITFLTLIRILRALQIPFTELANLDLINDEYLIPQAFVRDDVNSEMPVLKISDINQFIQLYNRSEGHCLALLVKLHDIFVSIAQKLPIWEAHEQSTKIFLSSDPHPSLEYPLDITIPTLQNIFASRGVIIPRDLGAYIHQTRLSKGLTLKEVSAHLNIAYTSVRNFEQKLGYRVKFSDILDLDKAFELKGELIAFGWRTFELYADISEMIQSKARSSRPPEGWYQAQIEYIEYLVILSRLYQCHLPENENWLSNFEFLVKGNFSLYEPFDLPQ